MQEDHNAPGEDPSAKIIPFIRSGLQVARRALLQGAFTKPASMTSFERYQQKAQEVKQSPLRVLFVKAGDADMPLENVKRYVHCALGTVLEPEENQPEGMLKISLREPYVESFKKIPRLQVIEPSAP